MTKAERFRRKLFGGSKRVLWSESDINRLQKIFGVTDAEVEQVLKATGQSQATAVIKFAMPDDAPTKWQFVASDGKLDRDGDIIDVAVISLSEFSANPIWHHMHALDRPIGMAPDTKKAAGKLVSVLELGLDVFPDAPLVQKMLVSGMCRACSIGFRPVDWSFNEKRNGFDFKNISLFEINSAR